MNSVLLINKPPSLTSHDVVNRVRRIIQQTPPPFSAKKNRGVPAYKLARKHKEVPLTPVQVEIKEFEILGLSDVAEEDVADKKSLPADSSEKITQQGTRARFRARV